ncbi:MAG: AMP-binding protein [Acidimicrobiales bacterium]
MSSLADDIRAALRLGAADPFLTTARLSATAQWGPGIGAMVAAAALRFPTRPAIVDGQGSIQYCQLDRRATNLAALLRRNDEGTVAILCRNHRGFVLGQVAAERAGRDVVLMSTALPASKLREVLDREQVATLIADDEFVPLIEQCGADVDVLPAEGDGPDSIWALSATSRLCALPRRRSRLVLLTSGTTGPPKGARRHNRAPRARDASLLASIPYQLGDTFLVAPPLFHAWGLSQATVAMATASTLVLRRRFDAADVVDLLRHQHVDVLAVVPLMLRRILTKADGVDGLHAPRIVASSGNVLQGSLAVAWMDRFGDHLYNLYGSTEAAIGTIAGPDELRRFPGTVGRPPRGVTLSILDERGMPVPVGRSGRVHLSNSMQFSGYTDGSDGDRAGTLLATGDLGYVDVEGNLHVNGRANDMIVTGGENVFPSMVEEVLEQLPSIDVSAVVGVEDEEYGQRVVAFVVPHDRRRSLDIEAVRSAVAAELPAFMVPREIVTVEALPMTTTGKVIRHRLATLGDAARY